MFVCVLVVLAGCAGTGGEVESTAETPAGTTSSTATVDSEITTQTPTDSDGDGLSDSRERELGTDPNVRDTDGDGLLDGVEAGESARYPGADPLHTDVYVEVDYMRGERPDAATIAAIESRFGDAPVSNPDGERGIALHLRVDEQVPASEPTWGTIQNGSANDLWDYRARYAQRIEQGHFYALVVRDARDGKAPGSVVGGYAFGNVFMVQQGARFEGVFVHELGHVLGLAPFKYDGIDSREFSFEQYPSAMNYNAPDDYTGLSNGTNSPVDHDDWAVIDRCLGWHIGEDGGPTAESALTCL